MNKKNTIIYRTGMALCISMATLAGCSSSPKRPMLYTDIAGHAYDNYEKANAAITRGDYEKAAKALNESYAQAVSIDKNELICKILLSAVSFRIQFPEVDLLDLPKELDVLLKQARDAAALTKETAIFNSIADVFECRAKLFLAQTKDGRFVNSEIQSILDSQIKALGKQPYYLAFLYRTKGECFHFSKDYEKASQAFVTAANIHTKNRYLHEIAYDWYLAAQCFSKAEKNDQALDAVQNALKYDRDAENSVGIAQDYMAAAYITIKGKPSTKDREQARRYASRAQAVYMTAGWTEQAEQCAKWIHDKL